MTTATATTKATTASQVKGIICTFIPLKHCVERVITLKVNTQDKSKTKNYINFVKQLSTISVVGY